MSRTCPEEQNRQRCNCTYEPCPRKAFCCDCIAYHLKARQLPACAFPAHAEATFNRSFDHFARLVNEGRV